MIPWIFTVICVGLLFAVLAYIGVTIITGKWAEEEEDNDFLI